MGLEFFEGSGLLSDKGSIIFFRYDYSHYSIILQDFPCLGKGPEEQNSKRSCNKKKHKKQTMNTAKSNGISDSIHTQQW